MENIIKTEIRRGGMYPLGFSRQGDWVQFTAIFSRAGRVVLELWDKGEKTEEIVLGSDYRMGNLYSVQILLAGKKVKYSYLTDGERVTDPCAKKLYREKDGLLLSGEADPFDWEGDKRPRVPYQQMLLYRLHVRGFTKHSMSGVSHKGTFEGLCEKIPYLKELGVNAVLLMPCYEFEDYMTIPVTDPRFAKKQTDTVKNFWGYGGKTWYFLPKRAFSSNKKSPETEFRNMVRTMHQNGMEVLMEFSFHADTNPYLIIECLRYWVLEYHIDGIYFNDGIVPTEMIAKDPVLSDIKLIARYWDEAKMFGKKSAFSVAPSEFLMEDRQDERRFANYHDGFLITARCFLKGDAGQTKEFANIFRKNSEKVAQINYIADNNGFTLADLVSYNQKHNEANGEDDHDGIRENYSWNCGQEGRTKKRLVMSLRERQMKNAMLMLFFSQGVPMIYAGDEFGNSQSGNNNVYCQDNKTGWVSWDQMQKNEAFLEFVKKLAQLRRELSVLQNAKMLTGQDYLACGSPDISWHGERAWYPDFTAESRLLGICLNGRYARGNDNRSIYIVFNMNWEDASIGFPRPDRGQCWKLLMDTAKTEEYVSERQKKEEKKEYYMKARSVAVFLSAMSEKKEEKTEKRTEKSRRSRSLSEKKRTEKEKS